MFSWILTNISRCILGLYGEETEFLLLCWDDVQFEIGEVGSWKEPCFIFAYMRENLMRKTIKRFEQRLNFVCITWTTNSNKDKHNNKDREMNESYTDLPFPSKTGVTKFSSFKKLPVKKSLRFHLTEAPEVPGDQKSIQNDWWIVLVLNKYNKIEVMMIENHILSKANTLREPK